MLGLGAPAGREDDDGGTVEVIGEVLVPAGLMRTVDVHVPALATGDVPVDELVARRGEALQGVEHLVPGHLELEVGHLVGVVLEELVKGVVGDDVGRGNLAGQDLHGVADRTPVGLEGDLVVGHLEGRAKVHEDRRAVVGVVLPTGEVVTLAMRVMRVGLLQGGDLLAVDVLDAVEVIVDVAQVVLAVEVVLVGQHVVDLVARHEPHGVQRDDGLALGARSR